MSNSFSAKIVAPEEELFAGMAPGEAVPEGTSFIEAQFSVEGSDQSWMNERRSDGTFRWCRAKRRSGEGFCRAAAMVGTNRCRIHGGSTPRGIASPHFKHGIYSKALPTRLFRKEVYRESLREDEREDFDRLRLDENITSLSAEIAILRMRVEDLLKLRDVGNTADAWKTAREATKAMIRARKYDQELEFDKAFDKLCEALLEDVDYNYHKEITAQIEQVRKLTDTEQRRLLSMQQLVTSNEFMTALNAILRAVKDNVSNREEVQATLTAIQRILIGAG